MRLSWLCCCLVGGVFFVPPLHADQITYVQDDGTQTTVEAQIYGSDRGAVALEMADGSLEVIPEARIVKREPGDGPEPLDEDAMIEQLTERFGKDKFRATSKRPFVVGLVLASPLESRIQETRATSFLREAVGFMKRVENEFKNYARQARISIDNPKHTLVALIFETDDDFEAYVEETRGGAQSLSAGNIAGFYSGLSNLLVLRLSECYDFATPLHEAMHQQVYNRGVFQRLAPLPVWFNEGIATSFEGNGDRIRNGPNRLNSHYARKSLAGGGLSWTETVQHDSTFRGDIFAGDAYRNAWSMHWFLLNNYDDQYKSYVERLGEKESLAEISPEQQLSEFEDVFGKSPAELESEFRRKLPIEMRRQRLSAVERRQAGLSETQSHLGEVVLTAVRQPNGLLQVQGQLTNISPLRDMAYYVTVVTGTGEFADWFVPDLKIRKSQRLPLQFVQKRIVGARGGPAGTFRVKIQSAIADSDTANAWKRGQLPSPLGE
ncbi:DUF1570 domain-containing protein [Thalassoroseus pseudoceratinae]|uniref:DUF1570 domain-containing protein n=1 Tax=Thalassoroseus pseudoceratinae TaxID=2713176 RepID=UPI0014218DEE|nr:DUF1570 domain-containing protein [Thalassoroseus pseudoceratinae]